MNPVVEEALTNIVRRLNEIEEFQRKYYKPIQADNPNQPGMATPGQIKYLSSLGFENFSGLTKEQAGIEIDKLKEKENSDNKKPIIYSKIKTKEDAEVYADVELESISEPPEVDTDDIGIDDEGLM